MKLVFVTIGLFIISSSTVASNDADPIGDCTQPTDDQLCVSLRTRKVEQHHKGDDVAGTCFEKIDPSCSILLIAERNRTDLTIQWRLYSWDRRSFFFGVFRESDHPNFIASNHQQYPQKTPVLERDTANHFMGRYDGQRYDLSEPIPARGVPWLNTTYVGKALGDDVSYELFKWRSSTTINFKPEFNYTSLNLNIDPVRIYLSNRASDWGATRPEFAGLLFSRYRPPTMATTIQEIAPTTPVEPEEDLDIDKKYRVPYIIALSTILLASIIGMSLYYFVWFLPLKKIIDEESTQKPNEDFEWETDKPSVVKSRL